MCKTCSFSFSLTFAELLFFKLLLQCRVLTRTHSYSISLPNITNIVLRVFFVTIFIFFFLLEWWKKPCHSDVAPTMGSSPGAVVALSQWVATSSWHQPLGCHGRVTVSRMLMVPKMGTKRPAPAQPGSGGGR